MVTQLSSESNFFIAASCTFFPPRSVILAHFFAAKPQKNRAFRYKSSEALMRFLWAFRYNPIAQRQLRIRPHNCQRQLWGQVIAKGNYLLRTRRSQFCSDKIAWSATKRAAKRSARSYHQPAAAPRAKLCRKSKPAANPATFIFRIEDLHRTNLFFRKASRLFGKY
jgi:hypothetical protein